MTTNPKAPKFRIRRNSAQAAGAPSNGEKSLDTKPETASVIRLSRVRRIETDAVAEKVIAEIRREGLTGPSAADGAATGDETGVNREVGL